MAVPSQLHSIRITTANHKLISGIYPLSIGREPVIETFRKQRFV